MLKPVAVALALVPLFATSAIADTVTTQADTLVVVTPNAPIVVNQGGQGGPQSVAAPLTPPGAAEMPPPPPPPHNGAPQNEDWNNVSHINGTPVKVGERGDYLVRFRKNNVSANPFGFFFGYYDVAAARALNNNLAIAVSITGWSFDGGSDQGYQMTASLPLYFRRTFSGPFLEGGLILRGEEDNYDYAYDCYDCSTTSTMSTSWVGPELLFGWHWTFDSGLNIAFAGGVAKRMGGNDNGGDTEANGYFRVGYAF